MPRVILKDKTEQITEETTEYCPVAAFINSPDGKQYVINPKQCIDCGMCQSMTNGEIVTEEEADAESVQFNAEKAEEWNQ